MSPDTSRAWCRREARLKLGTPSRTAFADRVRDVAGADPVVLPLVEPLQRILGTMLAEFASLTKQVLELARTALYEAAHTLLVRSKKWSSLRAWGMNIARRRGMARARVAVASKLAVILHRLWVDATQSSAKASNLPPRRLE
jgi:hypothetical protein